MMMVVMMMIMTMMMIEASTDLCPSSWVAVPTLAYWFHS